jgi:hypothetical protein
MTPQKPNARIALESLDDRLVPSTVDLTTRGSSGELNGGILTQVDARPTGTGVIRSFVRLQANGSGSSAEQGYNTTARPLQFDENSSPQFTRALTFGQVPWVEKNGGYYREFLLDINQKSSAPLLSLDDVKVFLADRSDLTGYDPATGTLPGAEKVWELGAGNAAVLNYRLNSGSGAGDMTLAVPNNVFADAEAGTFVYVYSKFGGLHQANSGFEEWAVSTSGNFGNPPDSGGGGGASTGGGGSTGSTGPLSSLSGYVYYDEDDDGVRASWESGIGGVTIKLQGTDVDGNTVVLTTETDANGFYKFEGLKKGTYTIFEEYTGDEYIDGKDTIGSLGGTVGNDVFTMIAVDWGQHGVEYNFGELRPDGGSA